MTAENGKLEVNARFDLLVREFVKVHHEVQKQEQKLKELKELKGEWSGLIMTMLMKAGAEGVKTKHGTIATHRRDTASLSDQEAFLDFVIKNSLFELMERRASADACREYANEHDGVYPPGVKINTHRYITVSGGKE
jgi:hypothetical protein